MGTIGLLAQITNNISDHAGAFAPSSKAQVFQVVVGAIQATVTTIAVLVALFGDRIREWLIPIKVEIEDVEQRNNFFDQDWLDKVFCDVYCHHLKVRIVQSHR